MQATRKLEFDAAHRLLNHKGKCKHLHGHRYIVEVAVSAKALDNQGMVIDFSDIKGIFGSWLDEHLDHNTICHPEDTSLIALARETKEPFIMPTSHANPTAENLSVILFGYASIMLSNHGIEVESVRVYETPNCWVDFNGGGPCS